MTGKSRLISYLFLVAVALFVPRVLGQDAAKAQRINTAIDKGISYLKRHALGDKGIRRRPGIPALNGWTLLEAGIPPNDEMIKALADEVRAAVPEIDQAYDASVAIFFLDKLKDDGDKPLIESLVVRLLACQNEEGGWNYHCMTLNDAEKNRVAQLVEVMKKKRDQGIEIKANVRSQEQIRQDMIRQFQNLEGGKGFGGDNSNTQFAMMALWVGRRHGLPVNKALELVEKRFRSIQLKTGHWGYDFPVQDPPEDDSVYQYPSMTCAGLLGIALGQGVQAKPRDLSQDPQIRRGFDVLAKVMESKKNTHEGKRDNFLYYLFSMERVAVVFNLKKIGPTDWYDWGVQALLELQNEEGSWPGEFGSGSADTCFALLFLKKANVAKELVDILQTPIRKGSGALDIPPPAKEEKKEEKKIERKKSDEKKDKQAGLKSSPAPRANGSATLFAHHRQVEPLWLIWRARPNSANRG